MELSEYLQRKKLTVTAFAKIAGVPQPTVWRILNGKINNPSPNIAERIEKATGGSVSRMELLYPNHNKAITTESQR